MLGSFLKQWNHRVHHWYTMFAGTSYYHQPQAKGRVFAAGELKGYFNDMTGKACWKGKLDQNGLPFNTLTNGKIVYFPVVLCQKALGHWDLWVMRASVEDREQFLKIAEYVAARQDAAGGWDTWGPLGQPDQYRYSAMSQGEAISVMVRAYSLTKEPALASACKSATAMMRKPVQDGGVCWYESDEVFLEEFPGPLKDTVLNGWLFALFGIYDYLLQFPDEDVKAFYDRTCASLIRSLPDFDSGFWSYYSSGTKRMASPFYHQLHLSQLQALKETTTEPVLLSTLDTWTRYAKSNVNKFRALAIKGIQKIKEPHEITLID